MFRARGRAGQPPWVAVFPPSRGCVTMPCSSAVAASRARFWFCGRSSSPKRSNSVRRWALTASTLSETSSAISRFVSGVANAESRTGRHSATRIWRCVGVSWTAAGPEPTAIVELAPAVAVARKMTGVSPKHIRSPSRSSRRPTTRSPLTNEPLRDRPSSTSTQWAPTRSSWACSRETSRSQPRPTAQSPPRPMVTGTSAGVSSCRTCRPSPSNRSRNGVPRRSASSRALSSAGVERCREGPFTAPALSPSPRAGRRRPDVARRLELDDHRVDARVEGVEPRPRAARRGQLLRERVDQLRLAGDVPPAQVGQLALDALGRKLARSAPAARAPGRRRGRRHGRDDRRRRGRAPRPGARRSGPPARPAGRPTAPRRARRPGPARRRSARAAPWRALSRPPRRRPAAPRDAGRRRAAEARTRAPTACSPAPRRGNTTLPVSAKNSTQPSA